MSITATELKLNLGKYLKLSEHEDIYITKNGKVIAKLSNPNIDRIEMAKSLLGVIPCDITVDKAREERISKI
jgi:antitoxin (DNA-binding transcriptional repressor) of toxin-antitoxin stability system